MGEIAFTHKVCKYLEDVQGAYVVPFVGHIMGMPGMPDRFIAHPKWSGWLEFKGKHTKLEDIQKIRIKALKLRGVQAWVIRDDGDGNCKVEDTDGGRVDYCSPAKLLDMLQKLQLERI